jgi:lysophospholipase L1-like esterase
MRITARAALLAALTFVAMVTPAAAGRAPVAPGSRYLALGDSVVFGYQEPQVIPAPNYHNAASFIGYPEQVGAALHLKVANAACPGETSASLISAKAQSNGCENTAAGEPVAYRRHLPLHVRYKKSQLAYAVSYLRAHPDTRLVSLMIGANDLFLCQKTAADGCSSPSDLHALFAKVARNIRTILSAIRHQANYRGQLAIVDYYSLNYALAPINNLILAGNKAENAAARPFNVVIADGFREFKAGSLHFGGNPCTAGLLNAVGPGRCGVHPAYAGQVLLAQAVERAVKP